MIKMKEPGRSIAPPGRLTKSREQPWQRHGWTSPTETPPHSKASLVTATGCADSPETARHVRQQGKYEARLGSPVNKSGQAKERAEYSPS